MKLPGKCMSSPIWLRARGSLQHVIAIATAAVVVAGCGDDNGPTQTETEGSVQVQVATTGTDLDPDGYTVVMDGTDGRTVGADGSVTFSDLAAGDHQVSMTGLAANCSVSDNPRTVSVTAGEVTQTSFAVVCAASVGDLTVTTSTTGTDPDPDGYTVEVGETISEAIDVDESITIDDLAAGDYSVELTGVASNCSVVGDNPRTVTVPSNAAAQTDFEIECSGLLGSVEVTTSTTGADLDPDGYTLNVEGDSPVPIGLNETLTVDEVVAGERTVELTGVASNCSVAGENPRTVTVTAEGSVSTTFDVTCLTQLNNQIVFDTNRDGNKEIYVMDPDGTNLMRLTTNVARDAEPFVSPNGTKILFVSDRDGDNEIFVMNADGTGQTALTSNGASDTEPAWSPDGTRIVFSSDRNGDSEVFIMNADGSDQTELTSETGRDGLAQFSPDGTQIVFSSERDGDLDIWVMDADGSSPAQLTDVAGLDFAPAWSPDGSQIAFTSERDGNREVYVMSANGSGQTRLTNNAAPDLAPQWSPDGSQLAFASERDGNSEVYVMDADGSNPTNITNNAANDFEVSWSR